MASFSEIGVRNMDACLDSTETTIGTVVSV